MVAVAVEDLEVAVAVEVETVVGVFRTRVRAVTEALAGNNVM